MNKAEQLTGLLFLNKPVGMTSHDLVDRVRQLLSQRSVGHTGTLDPLADGLMILCVGKATRIADQITAASKSYRATIKFGQRSATYDAEGITADSPHSPVPQLSPAVLDTLLEQFRGTLDQTVPAFSAVKQHGTKLYDLARRGSAFSPPVRTITIEQLNLVAYLEPLLTLDVRCSKGTYIRSLAHDIGEAVGCGAYLSSLTRTAIGSWSLAQASSLDEIRTAAQENSITSLIHPVETIWQAGTVRIRPEFFTKFAHGRSPAAEDLADIERPFQTGERVMIKSVTGAWIGLATAIFDSDSVSNTGHESLFRSMSVMT